MMYTENVAELTTVLKAVIALYNKTAVVSKEAIFQIIFNCKMGQAILKCFPFFFFFEAAMSAKINHITIYVIIGLYETAERSNIQPILDLVGCIGSV